MANDKREQLIELARTYWIAQANKTTEWDTAEIIADFAIDYAAATSEAQSDGWVAIETVDDYPPIGQRVMLASNRAGDRLIYESAVWSEETAQYAGKGWNDYVAWMPIPTYQRQSSEGDSNER